jgi:hypothetical protein
MSIDRLNIFYSWQMDIPVCINKRPIELAVKEACLNIEKENSNFNYLIDESTRDISGSPSIPNSIFSKINIADIFVADITPINSHHDTEESTSNPNVLLELGYAISTVGWERIILLFNKQFGKFPDDVAFDIDRHRILNFTIHDKNDKSGKGQLVKELTDAIKLIFEKDPQKPHVTQNISIESKKHNNDVNTIREYCNSIEIIALDNFIEDLPFKLHYKIFFFFEEFKGKIESSYYYLYDNSIKGLFLNFFTLWNESLSFGHKYTCNGRSGWFIFQMGNINTENDRDILDDISRIQMELKKAFRELLSNIRENWLEINLEECSNYAHNNYIEYHKREIE